MSAQKYVKVPVTIEAMQFPLEAENGGVALAMQVAAWMEENGYPWLTGNALEPSTLKGANADGGGIWIDPADGHLMIRTLEGDMKVSLGDWVIRGVAGEFYPCRPEIFEKTYVKAEQA